MDLLVSYFIKNKTGIHHFKFDLYFDFIITNAENDASNES